MRFSFRIRLKYSSTVAWLSYHPAVNLLQQQPTYCLQEQVLAHWSSNWAQCTEAVLHELQGVFVSGTYWIQQRSCLSNQVVPFPSGFSLQRKLKGCLSNTCISRLCEKDRPLGSLAPTQKKLESFPHIKKGFSSFKNWVSSFQLPVNSLPLSGQNLMKISKLISSKLPVQGK